MTNAGIEIIISVCVHSAVMARFTKNKKESRHTELFNATKIKNY